MPKSLGLIRGLACGERIEGEGANPSSHKAAATKAARTDPGAPLPHHRVLAFTHNMAPTFEACRVPSIITQLRGEGRDGSQPPFSVGSWLAPRGVNHRFVRTGRSRVSNSGLREACDDTLVHVLSHCGLCTDRMPRHLLLRGNGTGFGPPRPCVRRGVPPSETSHGTHSNERSGNQDGPPFPTQNQAPRKRGMEMGEREQENRLVQPAPFGLGMRGTRNAKHGSTLGLISESSDTPPSPATQSKDMG